MLRRIARAGGAWSAAAERVTVEAALSAGAPRGHRPPTGAWGAAPRRVGARGWRAAASTSRRGWAKRRAA